MSDEYPSDLLYTKDHEWTRVTGDRVVVGITRFAVDQLGDVTQVEVPEEGDEVSREQAFGTVESVKSVSDLFAPVSGKVVRVNAALEDDPELVNADPYGDGWMVEIELSDRSELDQLMTPDAYTALIAEHDG